ncbi:uncharacterized protein LOC114302114 [Camellia sinensis]|uniref:uncharacterized protein LOC114302114 n=1 Tax=Camellia sinensis TaxID=4442 RepID=UPI001035DEE9|nr:uncharacterized protein LOC114302114 [Camellia sinensis]
MQARIDLEVLWCSNSVVRSLENERVHQKACKREGARVRDNGQKLHLCHHHHHPAPPLHKRASNRYWYIDQNTLQSCEESAIRGSLSSTTSLCSLPWVWIFPK